MAMEHPTALDLLKESLLRIRSMSDSKAWPEAIDLAKRAEPDSSVEALYIAEALAAAARSMERR